MHSLRAHLRCLGLDGPRSVLHDFFGLGQVPGTESVSLRQQMARLRRAHVLHLNVIRVGFDSLAPADREAAERELDLAAHRMRQIYDQAAIGVGRVQHFQIAAADAGGLEDIGGDGEADDLCDRFSVDNDGVDAFFVLTYAGTRIGSARPSGCDKDGKDSGVVLAIEADPELTATVLAHEAAHFLGIEDHSSDPNNLLSTAGGREITAGQAQKLRSHCFMTDCPDL